MFIRWNHWIKYQNRYFVVINNWMFLYVNRFVYVAFIFVFSTCNFWSEKKLLIFPSSLNAIITPHRQLIASNDSVFMSVRDETNKERKENTFLCTKTSNECKNVDAHSIAYWFIGMHNILIHAWSLKCINVICWISHSTAAPLYRTYWVRLCCGNNSACAGNKAN